MDERIEIENGHVVMYRPTGPEEYQLVADSDFTKWPPRLEGQPIFYPVTNETYAREITEQWNIRDSGVGYFFRFLVRRSFADAYSLEKVGGTDHTEWWIPADKMNELNDSIVGKIEMVGRYPSE